MSKRQKTTSVQISSRFLWADVIRIIAIYFVLQLHTFFVPLDKVSVPLFVMLSGALLLNKKETNTTFFKKRMVKVLFPWVVWTVIYIIYYLFFSWDHQTIRAQYFNNNFDNTTFSQWIHFVFRMFFSALWFFPLIFSLYLLTPLVRPIMQHTGKFEKYYMVALWFLVFSLLPFIFNNSFFPKYEPNLLYTAFQYIGYFILGLILITLKHTKRIISILIISFFVACFFITNRSSFIDPAVVIASVAFFYLVFCCINYYDHKIDLKYKQLIAVISGATLGIYVIHGIIVGLLGSQINNLLSFLHIPYASTFILFCISAILIIVMQKIPLIKRIVP